MQDEQQLESARRHLERVEELFWVERARAGDTGAFERLLERYEKPVLYYVRRLGADAHLSLDISQEVWLEVFRGVSRLTAPEAFRVWLFRIAHHRAMRHLGRQRLTLEELPEAPADSPAEPEPGCTPEELHLALGKLPQGQREVLTLFYLEEMSVAEIAVVLDCPAGTVKSRLYHARLALKKTLEVKAYV